MKRSRFSEEQIIAILREQEAGSSTADVCRKHGVSSASFYEWKATYGGMDVSQARKLKALEDENASEAAAGGCDARQCRAEGGCLKKLVRPAARRRAVEDIRQIFDISERRACAILAVDRSSMRFGHRVVMMATCGRVFARSRLSVAGSATGRLDIMLAREGI